jgi:hypothetical protein
MRFGSCGSTAFVTAARPTADCRHPQDCNRLEENIGADYGPTTRFTSDSESRMDGLIPEAYAPYTERIFGFSALPVRRQPNSTWPKWSCVPRTTRPGSSDFQRVPTRWRWISMNKRTSEAYDPLIPS